MAHFVSMHAIDRSRWQPLKGFKVTEKEIEAMIGPYEPAECVSGDVFCIPIISQKEKSGILNQIATAILGQKVWGDCIQLNETEASKIGLNRR